MTQPTTIPQPDIKPKPKERPRPKKDDPWTVPAPLVDPTPKAQNKIMNKDITDKKELQTSMDLLNQEKLTSKYDEPNGLLEKLVAQEAIQYVNGDSQETSNIDRFLMMKRGLLN